MNEGLPINSGQIIAVLCAFWFGRESDVSRVNQVFGPSHCEECPALPTWYETLQSFAYAFGLGAACGAYCFWKCQQAYTTIIFDQRSVTTTAAPASQPGASLEAVQPASCFPSTLKKVKDGA